MERGFERLRDTFAENTRRYRAARRLSQEQVAERACMDRAYVGATERGETNPTLRIMSQLAYALDTSVIRLLQEQQEDGERRDE